MLMSRAEIGIRTVCLRRRAALLLPVFRSGDTWDGGVRFARSDVHMFLRNWGLNPVVYLIPRANAYSCFLCRRPSLPG